VPAGRHALGARARAPPGARRPALRQPQRLQRVPLRRRAGRHVPAVPRAALRLRGRRRQRPRARARRRELPQRRLLHPRQQRLRARLRLGPPPRQRVLPLGGARARVPPRRAALAGRAARGPPRGRHHAGQRLHARARPRHQDRRHHLRPEGPPPHRRRLAPESPPAAAHRLPARNRLKDPLQACWCCAWSSTGGETTCGVRGGVHGPAGRAAPRVPAARRVGDPGGGDAGEPAAADAERRGPAGAPGGARHPGAGGPAHGRAGRGRQPDELGVHPVARARRALARAGRRDHPLRQLHRGRQRLRVRHPRLRRRPPPGSQLRPLLSSGATVAARGPPPLPWGSHIY